MEETAGALSVVEAAPTNLAYSYIDPAASIENIKATFTETFCSRIMLREVVQLQIDKLIIEYITATLSKHYGDDEKALTGDLIDMITEAELDVRNAINARLAEQNVTGKNVRRDIRKRTVEQFNKVIEQLIEWIVQSRSGSASNTQTDLPATFFFNRLGAAQPAILEGQLARLITFKDNYDSARDKTNALKTYFKEPTPDQIAKSKEAMQSGRYTLREQPESEFQQLSKIIWISTSQLLSSSSAEVPSETEQDAAGEEEYEEFSEVRATASFSSSDLPTYSPASTTEPSNRQKVDGPRYLLFNQPQSHGRIAYPEEERFQRRRSTVADASEPGEERLEDEEAVAISPPSPPVSSSAAHPPTIASTTEQRHELEGGFLSATTSREIPLEAAAIPTPSPPVSSSAANPPTIASTAEQRHEPEKSAPPTEETSTKRRRSASSTSTATKKMKASTPKALKPAAASVTAQPARYNLRSLDSKGKPAALELADDTTATEEAAIEPAALDNEMLFKDYITELDVSGHTRIMVRNMAFTLEFEAFQTLFADEYSQFITTLYNLLWQFREDFELSNDNKTSVPYIELVTQVTNLLLTQVGFEFEM